MLRLRPDQVAALGDRSSDEFARRCAAEVRKHWPHSAAALGEDRLLERVRSVIAFAARFSIAGKAELLRLVNVAMALDSDFAPAPPHDWIEPYLADPKLRPADRVERLSARVRSHLRGEVPPP